MEISDEEQKEFDDFFNEYLERANPLYDYTILKRLVLEKYNKFAEKEITTYKMNALMRVAGFQDSVDTKNNNQTIWVGLKWK